MKSKYLPALFYILTAFLSAQQNTINFDFRLNYKTMFNGGSVDFTAHIDSGSFVEGDDYIIPEKNFEGTLASLNPAYDAIENGVFKIEDGAIDEDLYLDIILSGLVTNTGLYERTFDEDLFIKLEIIVRKEKGGEPVNDNYYLNEGKFLILKIEKGDKFRAFTADSIGLDVDSLGFAYIEEEGFNGLEISTVDLGDSIMFKAEHMSKFGGGKGSLRNKTISDIHTEMIEGTIKGFALQQNYPNPFNPETSIEYSIPEAGNVELAVYNTLGEKVEILVKGNLPGGNYRSVFSAAKFPSGIYLYELKWGNSRIVKKMILMK